MTGFVVNTYYYKPTYLCKSLKVSAYLNLSLCFTVTWHQYDDAVYSQSKIWNSVLNFVTSNLPNPSQGRYLAMEMMLPDWDCFHIERTHSSTFKGSEALETINQVIYCMENKKIETGNNVQNLEFKDFSMELVGLLIKHI